LKLILNVPLKTFKRQFDLYKIFVLPTKLSEDKFISFSVDFQYFAISTDQHEYFLFTEADLRRCISSQITVCPADVAINNKHKVTCLSSLYFQSTPSHSACRRHLLLNYQSPTLQKHMTTWLYYFLTPQQITLHCLNDNKWTTHTETLTDTGLIINITGCSISTNDAYTLPELYESTHAMLDNPHVYLPPKSSIVSHHEVKLLEEITPTEIRLDAIKSQVMSSPHTYDVESLFHAHTISSCSEQRTYWHQILNTTLCAAITTGILLFSFNFYLRHKSLCCYSNRTILKTHT
jgi:hypothetical protein